MDNDQIILLLLAGKAKYVFAELERQSVLEKTFGRLVRSTELFQYSIN